MFYIESRIGSCRQVISADGGGGGARAAMRNNHSVGLIGGDAGGRFEDGLAGFFFAGWVSCGRWVWRG